VTPAEQLDAFVAFSAAVTGFTQFDLRGSGQAEAYRSNVAKAVGEEILSDLLETWARISSEPQHDDAATHRLLRREVFSDPKLGPVARNVVKLWYVGIWWELPPAWIDAYGAREGNDTHMVSPAAYTQGLLWTAIGANPPGVRGPGYASWAGPPRIAPGPGSG
jgi:hypothetical protein